MSGTFGIEQQHALSTKSLMYFNGADVSLYVNWVAMTMFKDFKLSIKGQRDISSCLSNLPIIECADSRLTMGWGPDSFIRHPGVHQYGYEHMTVMVALASIFHEPYAAEICHAYAAAMATTDDIIPHMSQWKNHLRALCGVFTASTFSQLVENYIRLDPYSVGPGSNMLAKRCRVQPKAMAEGLRALSEVVSKKRKQVTLVGGAVIGWYAALSEFYYDLKTVILSRTGETLHGHPHDEDIQVVLVYHEDPGLEVLTHHWSTVQDKGDDDDPFWSRHVHYLPFGGRVQWHSLLPEVFGHAFRILEHEESKTLADLIGSAARALEGDHQTPMDGNEHSSHESSSGSHYGAGLIQNLTDWLPELRRIQGRMERQLRKPVPEAAEAYEAAIDQLTRLCDCNICHVVPDRTNAVSVPASDANPSTNNASTPTNPRPPPKDGYCLPVICETIVTLGLAVSRMVVKPAIHPSREGVQALYARQSAHRTHILTTTNTTINPNQPSPTSNEARAHRLKYIYSSEWRAPVARRLANAIELFAGTRPSLEPGRPSFPSDVEDGLVAVAHEGICAYAVTLKRFEGSVTAAADVDVIEVTSGAVCVRQKVFTRVCTVQPYTREAMAEWREAVPWEEVLFEHRLKPLYCR